MIEKGKAILSAVLYHVDISKQYLFLGLPLENYRVLLFS